MTSKKDKSAVAAFIALPDAEKNRIAAQFNREFSCGGDASANGARAKGLVNAAQGRAR
jgi:hypothetical protein